MIYRYRVYEEKTEQYWLTQHSRDAVKILLEGFPQQLAFVLNDAEVHNEIIDLSKKEAYLKITTDIDEEKVILLVNNSMRISGLHGSRLI